MHKDIYVQIEIGNIKNMKFIVNLWSRLQTIIFTLNGWICEWTECVKFMELYQMALLVQIHALNVREKELWQYHLYGWYKEH